MSSLSLRVRRRGCVRQRHVRGTLADGPSSSRALNTARRRSNHSTPRPIRSFWSPVTRNACFLTSPRSLISRRRRAISRMHSTSVGSTAVFHGRLRHCQVIPKPVVERCPRRLPADGGPRRARAGRTRPARRGTSPPWCPIVPILGFPEGLASRAIMSESPLLALRRTGSATVSVAPPVDESPWEKFSDRQRRGSGRRRAGPRCRPEHPCRQIVRRSVPQPAVGGFGRS
jgi:hypothetical protein